MNNENNGINPINNNPQDLYTGDNEVLELNDGANNQIEKLDFVTDNDLEQLTLESQPQTVPIQDVQIPTTVANTNVIPNNANDTQIQSSNIANVSQVVTQPVQEFKQETIQSIPTTAEASNSASNNGVIRPTLPVDSTNIGFVASSAPLKKKKNPLIIGSIITGSIILLAVLGYFVIYPLIVKNVLNNPKKLFDKSVDYVANEVINVISENIHNKEIIDASLKVNFEPKNIDDNIFKELMEFNNFTYKGTFGIDPANKLIELGYGVEDKYKKEYSQSYYLKNNEHYTRYSTNRNLIRYGSWESAKTIQMFDGMSSLFEDAEKIKRDDLIYLTTKISTILKSNITEDVLSKEDASITINNQSFKVIKNNYTLNKSIIIKNYNSLINGILEDQKCLEILAKLSESDVKVIEDTLENIIHNDERKDDENEIPGIIKALNEIPDDYSLTISIFTYGNKVEVLGFSVADNKKNDMHYYSRNRNFELIANAHNVNEDMVTHTLKIVGKNENGKVNVEANYDEKNIFALVITNFEKNNILFDYTIFNYNDDDSNMFGTIKFVKTINEKNSKSSIEFEYNSTREKIGFSIDVNRDWTSEVANINNKNAKDYTYSEFTNIDDSFKQSIEKDTPLGILNETIGGDKDFDINDYYNNNMNNNNNNNNNPSSGIIENAKRLKMCQTATCPSTCTTGYCYCSYIDQSGVNQSVTCYIK